MKKYFCIGFFGFLGAIARYLIKNVHLLNYRGNFPFNTLLINITGTFLMALIMTSAFGIWKINETFRLGLCTGFLGAFTTFSSMCKETVLLLTGKLYIFAFVYVLLSILLGLASAFLGVYLVSRIVENDDELEEVI